MVMLYTLWVRTNTDDQPKWKPVTKRVMEDKARDRELQANADAIDAAEHAKATGHMEKWITTVVLPAGETPWIATPTPNQGDTNAPD